MSVYNNSLWKTRQTQKTKQNSGPDQMQDNASHQYDTKKSKWQCDAALRRAAAQLFYVIERVRKI